MVNSSSDKFRAIRIRNVVILFVCIIALNISSCSQNEIGRISIKSPGIYELNFSHSGGAIEVWTDFDVEYVDEPVVWYDIFVFEEQNQIADTRCDPFSIDDKLMARSVVVEGKNKLSYLAKMDCNIDLPAGSYLAKVSFYAEGRDIHIFWADIIFK